MSRALSLSANSPSSSVPPTMAACPSAEAREEYKLEMVDAKLRVECGPPCRRRDELRSKSKEEEEASVTFSEEAERSER